MDQGRVRTCSNAGQVYQYIEMVKVATSRDITDRFGFSPTTSSIILKRLFRRRLLDRRRVVVKTEDNSKCWGTPTAFQYCLGHGREYVRASGLNDTWKLPKMEEGVVISKA